MKIISQSGRSMTEIIGVLAIIGVLSVGGIAGYNYAINKHNANELIYDIDILSNDISRYIMAHNPDILPDDLAYTTSRQRHDIESFLLDNGYFEVGVLDVPQKLCQMLQDTHWDKPVSLYIGGQKYQGNNLCTSDIIGRVAYVFSDNFGPNTYTEPDNDRCKTSAECTKCESCENNMCITTKPLTSGSNCYACDEKIKLELSKEACAVCPERISASSMWKTYCLMPEENTDCTGSQGSACDLPDKDYKGFCMNKRCVDLGICPAITHEMAANYCASQGGLPSVAELSAISANPDACATDEQYLKDSTQICPTTEQKVNKGRHTETICAKKQVWSSQVVSYYPDYWVVSFNNGDLINANKYVYQYHVLCNNQMP